MSDLSKTRVLPETSAPMRNDKTSEHNFGKTKGAIGNRKLIRSPAPDIYLDMRSVRLEKRTKRLSKVEVQAAARAIAPFIYLRSHSAGPKDIITKSKKSFRTIRLTRPSFNIPTISSHLKSTYDLPMLLLDSALTLKRCTKSSNVVLYLKDDNCGEMFQFSTHVIAKSHVVNFKIEPGTTLAAYVAYSMQYVVTEDCLGDARFPKGLGWHEDCSGPALCVPISTPLTLEMFAVIELSREVTGKPYTKAEVEACLNLCGWIGATVQENQDSMLLERERTLYDYLKQLIAIYFCQPIELNMFFSELVVSARIALCAQSSAFYTVAHVDDRGDLEMDMYVETGSDKHQRKQWFKLQTSRTVAAKVALTGTPLNLSKKELKSNKYNTAIFKPLPCRNILSVPVFYSKRIIGVVEVINKTDAEKFHKIDIEIMNNIMVFCHTTLSCFTLKEDMRRLLARLNVRKKMLEQHMPPCEHDMKIFHEMDIRIPPEIICHDFVVDEANTKMELCAYAQELLKYVLGQHYLAAVEVDKLLMMVVKATPDAIFHNMYHCFSMFHAVFFIISMYPELFSLNEKETMLLTAICHGVHNSTMIATFVHTDVLPDYSEWKPFKYNETLAYIEVILKVCGVFPQKFRPEDKEKMVQISQLLVFCYQTNYFEDGKEIVQRLDSKLFKWNHPLDRIRMKRAVMINSTFYLHWKPFIMSAADLLRLHTQLFNEVAELDEKFKVNYEKGLPLIPNPNRSLQKIAIEQIEFIENVVLHWIYLINVLFPNTKILHTKCLVLLQSWKGLLNVTTQKNIWIPGKSIVYRTKNLRNEIMNILDSVQVPLKNNYDEAKASTDRPTFD